MAWLFQLYIPICGCSEPFFPSLLFPLNRCQEKSSRLGQDGKNKTSVNQSVDKDESVGNDKKKISLFHLTKFYA